MTTSIINLLKTNNKITINTLIPKDEATKLSENILELLEWMDYYKEYDQELGFMLKEDNLKNKWSYMPYFIEYLCNRCVFICYVKCHDDDGPISVSRIINDGSHGKLNINRGLINEEIREMDSPLGEEIMWLKQGLKLNYPADKIRKINNELNSLEKLITEHGRKIGLNPNYLDCYATGYGIGYGYDFLSLVINNYPNNDKTWTKDNYWCINVFDDEYKCVNVTGDKPIHITFRKIDDGYEKCNYQSNDYFDWDPEDIDIESIFSLCNYNQLDIYEL